MERTPAPGDTISWRGRCTKGLADGGGMLQWFLQGKPSGDTKEKC